VAIEKATLAICTSRGAALESSGSLSVIPPAVTASRCARPRDKATTQTTKENDKKV
jgi:hypothetical protein